MNNGVNQILQKRVTKGMTLVEMLCFIALFVCVVIGGKFGNQIVGSYWIDENKFYGKIPAYYSFG